jgi:hypothetical protein
MVLIMHSDSFSFLSSGFEKKKDTLLLMPPCSVLSTLATFRGNIKISRHLYIEDGGSIFPRNVGSQLSDYTVS